VLSDSNTDDAEQRQEHAHTTPESGTLTHDWKNSLLKKFLGCFVFEPGRTSHTPFSL